VTVKPRLQPHHFWSTPQTPEQLKREAAEELEGKVEFVGVAFVDDDIYWSSCNIQAGGRLYSKVPCCSVGRPPGDRYGAKKLFAKNFVTNFVRCRDLFEVSSLDGVDRLGIGDCGPVLYEAKFFSMLVGERFQPVFGGGVYFPLDTSL
jgi:hypothetical protein